MLKVLFYPLYYAPQMGHEAIEISGSFSVRAIDGDMIGMDLGIYSSDGIAIDEEARGTARLTARG
ncbi:hypothetical protein BABINDRAFT_162750 [Babjeviella inositovora NRRL Y-12698]|uniref:Uncharacterized protein n=1 Tax=Babjeviella inositovora NRRL Y-12698 TaxID=984486 RepID=A0A1E3QLI3_9ASCO|nr:uncharacterized protein BABINDRAFT_162750 [Babjeviella inositovora NRRL Y-12698]ODQ78545.1 hypothetical protein BABINDRAFT_162750 [Babjeviella inositovora NRRL Y-12698]